jgi:hypothetical protein
LERYVRLELFSMNRVCVFAGVALLFATSAYASDGVPSASKLSRLGLSSMAIASDTQGMEVRGHGRGILGARFFSLTGTSLVDTSGGVITGTQGFTSGTLGTLVGGNPNLNVPFFTTFSQLFNGNQFILNGVVSGNVSGFAN